MTNLQLKQTGAMSLSRHNEAVYENEELAIRISYNGNYKEDLRTSSIDVQRIFITNEERKPCADPLPGFRLIRTIPDENRRLQIQVVANLQEYVSQFETKDNIRELQSRMVSILEQMTAVEMLLEELFPTEARKPLPLWQK